MCPDGWHWDGRHCQNSKATIDKVRSKVKNPFSLPLPKLIDHLRNQSVKVIYDTRRDIEDGGGLYHPPLSKMKINKDTTLYRDSFDLGRDLSKQLKRVTPQGIVNAFNTKHCRSKMDVALGSGEIAINGSLKVKGKWVGWFSRSIVPSKDGLIMQHHEFFINGNKQHAGVGTEFLANCEKQYRKMGIKKIEIEQAVDVGSYIWPSMGYDFQKKSGLIKMRKCFTHFLVKYHGFDIERALKEVSRMNHSWDFVRAKVDGKPVGKQFVFGTVEGRLKGRKLKAHPSYIDGDSPIFEEPSSSVDDDSSISFVKDLNPASLSAKVGAAYFKAHGYDV